MPSVANQTPLWRQAFTVTENDPFSAAKARLENNLVEMGELVEQLLKQVVKDCHGLTLHDISHLDAVWEMASLIAGEDYPLNPAEAYVLGGAILLHDAGLTSASYPRGLASLTQTVEWRDIASGELRRAGIEITDHTIVDPPMELKPVIVFAVLRELHAKQAEKMATERWSIPDGDDVYLIENSELRQAFGESIGRVAQSHHWSIDKVASDLRDNVGVGVSLPPEWAISERKLACILRCADAAHIDRRRAPTILFAATKPVKLSHVHWSAQNRINKPTVDGSTLVYTAGSAFSVNEADAWWLVYDLVKLVDREIRSSNALLEELQFPRLRVTRVLGAESPRALSSQIRPVDWQPIDAEVRVSDPVHLALTLGGRNLYGRDPVAPIREIMQNAADAIRARRVLEDRDTDWGLVAITIEPDADDSASCYVHIDDDGIGMTERVLSGPLIDFGKSIWNSDLLRSEFPGLQSKSIKPIGKFGIGFFSVFELADQVTVISKHYESGVQDARALEFKSLNTRPHIRGARHKELPRDKSTRVSLKVVDKTRVSGSIPSDMRAYPFSDDQAGFTDSIISMIPLLDVRVLYHNRIDGTSFEHKPNVYNIDAESFLDEVLVLSETERRESVKSTHSSRLSLLIDKSGIPIGRAALAILPREGLRRRSDEYSSVSVGGFCYRHGVGLPVSYVGVIEGATEEASRREAFSKISSSALAEWATEQQRLIDRGSYLKVDLMKACESIVRAGGDPGDLPYAFNNGKLITYEETRVKLGELDEVLVVLNPEYGENFALVGYSDIPSYMFEAGVNCRVFIVNTEKDAVFETRAGKAAFKGIQRRVNVDSLSHAVTAFRQFIKVVQDVWGCEIHMEVKLSQIFDRGYLHLPDARWVISIKRVAS